MKTKLFTILFLIFSIPTFAQLTKAVVESKFPLLKLPYTTKSLLSDINIYDGAIENQAVYKFLKSDVTTILKHYKDGALFFNHESKCYAIGRVVNGGKTYILYLESAMNKNSGFGDNEIFIVSLDTNYQPIISQSVSYFMESISYDKDGNTIYNITDIYASFMILPNGLNLKMTDTYEKSKNKETSLEKKTNYYNYYFDAKGVMIEIFKK